MIKHFLPNILSISCTAYRPLTAEPAWLNFFMKREEKEELFNRGFQAALDFNTFDWEKVQIRKNDAYHERQKY
jgi:hypothetical protein